MSQKWDRKYCFNCKCNLQSCEREIYPNVGTFCDVYCYREWHANKKEIPWSESDGKVSM